MNEARKVAAGVVVTLQPEGFFMIIKTDNPDITGPALLSYLNGELRIPGLRSPAVLQALKRPRGELVLIAPPLGAVQVRPVLQPSWGGPARPAIRWVRPLHKPDEPTKVATKFLVVDTSESMVKVCHSVFGQTKLTVSYANQPQLFLAAISEPNPADLILLGARLGKIDGGLLATKIRTAPATMQTPVIMYSGLRPRNEIVQQFDCGITDYLVMPLNADAFRTKILSALAQVKKTLPGVSKDKHVVTGYASEVEEVKASAQNLTLKDLVKKVKDLLAVPHIVQRVMKITDDSSSGAKELAQAVQSDTATMAMVLKKANTVFYGRSEPIKDVQEAIVRIGMTEVKSSVLGMAIIKQFSKEQKSNGFDRLEFWHHCLATAVIGKILAQQVRYLNPEDVFIAGLLHDIGKIILDEYANPPYNDVLLYAIKNGLPLIRAEKEVLSFSHIDVGRAVVQNWRFPEAMQLVVLRHHEPEAREREKSNPMELQLVRLVFIANLLAKAVGVGNGGDLSLQELPLSSWVQSFTKMNFGAEVFGQFQKDLVEVGEFLEMGDSIGQTVNKSDQLLPEVLLIDPLGHTRPLQVIKIHLSAMGYQVHDFAKEGDLPPLNADKAQAICYLLDRYDKVQPAWANLRGLLQDNHVPLVFVLPETEREYAQKNMYPERPDFLTANQTIFYEPFDASRLESALEGH